MEEGMTGFYVGPPRGGGGGGGGGGGSKCGRWNPTSEQIKVLTELFRSGLRTPTTDQIQKISSQLSFYGKIESKNVFYWFQNHKARERQKRRRVVLVDDDEDNLIPQHLRCKDTPIPSTKRFSDMNSNYNEVSTEPERVKETLQLFPLNTLSEEEGGCNNKENYNSSVGYTNNNNNNGAEMYDHLHLHHHHHHPMLDLRLSFL